MAVGEYERTLEETPTWAVAVVCFVLVLISIFVEHIIHIIGKWLKNKHKRALYEALEKIKGELMIMGFISLLLIMLQTPITNICIPKSVGATWHPCKKGDKSSSAYTESQNEGRKLLQILDSDFGSRRMLAAKVIDKCTTKGKVALVSAYGIHELHVFIFVLAVVHVLYCITTLALGRTKMIKWKVWEDESKTLEYQYYNDPERFRFARDTTFGRRHLNFWSKSPILLWIVCFFRQFFTSVTKVDYLTLRHGFIIAHLAPESETKFDFQKYISRSLEEDFVVVVGISPIVWFFAVLFLLSNTYGLNSYLWLPFLPLIVILLVGTKLLVIITKMGLSIQDRGAVVRGAPVVQPGDDLFWFGRPKFILFLIHLVLFQNAFQLAFFAWSTYEFGLRNCFHRRTADLVIRISMGVVIQFLCSYVTLPLYALVTQMGSTMKPTIFNDKVATALKNWHRTAKKNTKHINHSESTTPFTSRPATPTHGMSPVHLLHNYHHSSLDSTHASPTRFNVENDYSDIEDVPSPSNKSGPNEDHFSRHSELQERPAIQDPSSMQLPPAAGPIRNQHEINIGSSDFSFSK
ncbi:MLO-like protein 6 isoform X1 [Quercus robur]|uniref:MLO-like protein 6 isoform X1 n=1 Tax=Quercus robur TaxID=38942 RepID=UPI0021612EE2|nr:MLO-like protein 6 isoform X1 [Quercus robur]